MADKEQEKLIERKFKNKSELVSVLASVYPQSAEREMKRYLRRYANGLHKIITRAQKDIASGRPKKAVLRRASRQIEELGEKYDLTPEMGKISRQVADTEEAQFRRSFYKTVGVEMKPFDKDMLQKEQDDWTLETIGAIALYLMMMEKKLDKVASIKETEAEMEKLVKEADEITEISRNRVGDLMASVNTKIYNTFGIKRYVWRTRRDHKVRGCHRSFDGHIFRVDQPPEIWYETKHGRVYTGRFCHPGEDYNCRCRAIPLFTKEAVMTILTREKWKKTA